MTAPPTAALAVPIPHRKTIRNWLLPYSQRRDGYALLLVAIDFAWFAAMIAATIWFRHPLPKLLCGLMAGFVIGRLFVLGHDACHQSFTSSRKLNRVLGRLVFLPSLTPYSLWETGHNVVHHGYTNLRGFDFVWAPLTLDEYRALPPFRRRLERLYRSGWAPWLYYFIEIWWRKMYFPDARQMPTRRAVFVRDNLLVTAAALLWSGSLAAAAIATGQSVALLLFAGFVLPLLFWNAMIGFVVYVHHTHARVVWHDDKAEWMRAQPFVSTTVHLRFRPLLGFDVGALLHHIMEHTAHHVDMGIPLYHLRDAQRVLEARLPGHIVIQTFSWRWYFATARHCKLYDYRQQCWTDWSGRPGARSSALGI